MVESRARGRLLFFRHERRLVGPVQSGVTRSRFRRLVVKLDHVEQQSDVLVASRQYRICNIAFSVLLGIPAIILGVVLRKEPCDDPLASLLILTGVLPLCMAVKLAVLLRKTDERSASWSGQKAFSFVIGGIYFGVRILAQIYYFSSPNCSQNVLTAALFYMIVDYCTVCEGCAMLNSSFVRTLARRLKLNTEELFGPGDIDEEQSDDDEALTQAALSTRNSMP